MNNISYIFKKSNELNKSEIKEMIDLTNEVYEIRRDFSWYQWKYLENIYGDSLICLAYEDDKLVACKSFWKTKIFDKTAYQSCDAAVLPVYRYEGIFTNLFKKGSKILGDKNIYSYPNDKAYPVYKKLGFKDKDYFYLNLKLMKTKPKVELIEDEFLKWKFRDSVRKKYYCMSFEDKFFLLDKNRSNIYYLIGEINSSLKDEFTKVEARVVLEYTKKKSLIYRIFKRRGKIVAYNMNKDIEEIPIYMGDFF